MTYSTESDYLYVAPGTGRVKILSYFSWSEVVKCEYRMVRQYTTYDSDGKPHTWEDWKDGTAYYYIKCLGDDPGPDPDPDPDPDTDTYSHVKTIEGIPMWYCLTTINNERACVIMVPPFRPSSESCIDKNVEGKVTIPSANTNGYPVRKIASGAFLNNKKITEVVIPSSVKYISENSFYGCYSLEKVVCENPTPPTGQAIKHICSNDQNVTLYVPKGTVSAYKAADGWSNFKEIKEIETELNEQILLTVLPSGGEVTAGTKVYLSTTNVSDCDIYYTLDGKTPTKNSTPYPSSGITINNACTLKAIAYKSGYEDSDVLTATYTIKEEPKPKLVLSASPSGGQVSAGTKVTLTAKANGSSVSGCDIYYTTNGSTPSRNNGTKYSSGITINNACTLKAIAYKSGYEDSDVLTVTYTIKETPKPKLVLSASPSGGQVSAGTTVTLTAKADGSTVSGCDIYFTTNGTTPSKSNGTKYSSSITINSACTLKAIAYKSGYEDSEVLTATYTIKEDPKPKLVLSASPSGGQVSEGTKVYLTAKANGSTVYDCDIYYTTNGTTPSKSNGTKYSSGIPISSACTLKAIAYKSGYTDSNVLSTNYTIESSTNKMEIKVQKISAGYNHSLIVKKDGTLWACGDNWRGCLGDGTKTDRNVPVKIMDEVAFVSSGSWESKIIKTDGTLWAIGHNYYGSIGDGTTTDKSNYVEIMDDVASVAVGYEYSLIVRKSGSLWACGKNEYGQLGDGTSTERHMPVFVMNDVASVATGDRRSFIIKKDGSLWACGLNARGEFGDGTKKNSSIPVKIMDDVASVASGSYHSLIVKKDGTLWACGSHYRGLLGNGETNGESLVPVKILDNVAFADTEYHSLVVKKDSSLWSFGYNSYGQLGDGTTTDRATPVKIADGVIAVSAGCDFSLFVKKDGTLWACGKNDKGQLGNGTTTDQKVPVMIMNGLDDNTKLFITASPLGGDVPIGTKVYLSSSIFTNEVYYTINGNNPTKNSTKYNSSGIAIKENCTLKAIAYKDGYLPSDVLTETYTIKVDDISISITSAGYATFYSSESAYMLPNGLSAQIVTGASNGKLTYKTIADGSVSGIVPKGTAVMLVSDNKQAGTYTLTSSESTATYTGANLLHGSDEATTTTGDGYHYKLSYGPSGTGWRDVFGWYWGAQGGAPFQIEGHKAWLVVPRGNGTRAAGFSMDGEALGIGDVNDNLDDDCYDLQGRRVSQPTKKGVYIRNGHKVVNR